MSPMKPKHHIPANVLAAYATGSLSEAFSLMVATHLSLCDQCRADALGYESVGGVVLDTINEVEVSQDALAKTMDLILEQPVEEAPAKTFQRGSVFPAPLQDYAGRNPDEVKWRSVGAGVKQAKLPCAGKAQARLLYIPGGTAVPDHSHNGLELTLVLQGAFSDEEGRFARGDVEVGDDDLTHTPVAEKGEACICLAVTEGPLKFKGIIPRLVQPFIGI